MLKHQVLNREVRSRVDTGGAGSEEERRADETVMGVRASQKHHQGALG